MNLVTLTDKIINGKILCCVEEWLDLKHFLKIFYTTILIINVTDSSHRMNEINQLKTQANLNEQTSKFSYDMNVEFSTFVICKLLPVDLKYGAATSLIRILNTLQINANHKRKR